MGRLPALAQVVGRIRPAPVVNALTQAPLLSKAAVLVAGVADREVPLFAERTFVGMFSDPAKSWPDLVFLRENWDGPIVLKGVLHPDDARLAADAGMDGVVVSNHGGRQVAGSVAAADALPRVVDAVGDRLTVLFDSGVRTGDDVFKARSRSAPVRFSWAAPTSTDWAWTARPASST
ncbi:L-lactate dehydrogenase [Streptomyces tendae]